MFLAPLLLALAPEPVAEPKEVRKQFIQFAAAKDHDGCLALWKANPALVLPTIDADLEGSLKVRETSKEPDLKKIEELHARALWGAEIAVEATGHPILFDYASSFVGWNESERKSFRAGQKAYKTAMDALAEKDVEAALGAAMECLKLTGPLGDWWGSAMGCSAIAAAQQELKNHEKALESAAFARIIYHDLGLAGDEYQILGLMIDECRALRRWPRARASIDRAIELATALKDDAGLQKYKSLRTELESLK
jgi:hypothetical protein